MNLPERERWRLGARKKKDEVGRAKGKKGTESRIQSDRKCEERKDTGYRGLSFLSSDHRAYPPLVDFKKFLRGTFFSPLRLHSFFHLPWLGTRRSSGNNEIATGPRN